MKFGKAALPALALMAAVAGAAAIGLPFQGAAAQANSAQADRPPEQHFMPGRHIEGRIAFLKAELKITDAQAPQFDKLAAAMRENAKAKQEAFEQLRADRDKPRTALDNVEMRAKFAALRTANAQRFLAAFKPLYESLSDEQKKAADELFTHHRHGFRHRE